MIPFGIFATKADILKVYHTGLHPFTVLPCVSSVLRAQRQMDVDSGRKQGPCCQAAHSPAPKPSRALMSKFCWAFGGPLPLKGIRCHLPWPLFPFPFPQDATSVPVLLQTHHGQLDLLVLTLVFSNPPKAQLKVGLLHVFLALFAKYIPRVHFSPLLSPSFKPPSFLPRTICKSLQTFCFYSWEPVYAPYTKLISCHPSAQNPPPTPLHLAQHLSQSLGRGPGSTWSSSCYFPDLVAHCFPFLLSSSL